MCHCSFLKGVVFKVRGQEQPAVPTCVTLKRSGLRSLSIKGFGGSKGHIKWLLRSLFTLYFHVLGKGVAGKKALEAEKGTYSYTNPKT